MAAWHIAINLTAGTGEKKMSNIQLSEYQLQSLGRATAKTVTKYFKKPENQKRFEQWFLEKHGYTWQEHLERRNSQ
ncbi:MAG TPA: hypothetical protein DHW31_09855 [Bacteroides graminisolvens]|uniref:Uncharacterized protein n=1 Tax=Bacteroides graminisolvens TaxID=477666 RepID=A0A3D2SI57_9BACE|nr:hypothetical protein [Bacteroides graminisolvens]